MSKRLASWVESANSAETEFPLNNLPCGVFSLDGDVQRCGVAIGDMIFDVAAAEVVGLIRLGGDLFKAPSWNRVMSEGPSLWDALRARLIEILSEGSDDEQQASGLLIPQSRATLHMPFQVSEFTDFYASRHHATNVGTMFRGPVSALPENWLSIPIGYNGRASSVVLSGNPIRRPWGQVKRSKEDLPRFAPSARFDFELELGAVVGVPSEGPVTVDEADKMIFGFVLLNDWSARDIQAWEYRPLGPFQSKATATTISPWIVTTAALEEFRVDGPDRERPLLPYLEEPGPMLFDIKLAIELAPQDNEASMIAKTNAKELYFSSAQQLAHHTTSGCPMRTGDLLGSGTISGPAKAGRGSLLELSWGGHDPITLEGSGDTRQFLEDGDTVTMTGYAEGEDYKVGFGACSGQLLPAMDNPYEG